MQLHLDRPGHAFLLRVADDHHALVNEMRLEASFIIAPDRLIEGWPVRDIASLTPHDIEPLLALAPELVLLGSGGAQAFPSPELQAACLSRGVGLETMTNAAAARTFNVLAGEGRRVVAGLLIA